MANSGSTSRNDCVATAALCVRDDDERGCCLLLFGRDVVLSTGANNNVSAEWTNVKMTW